MDEIAVTRLTLDALKPREVDIVELAWGICEIRGVHQVEITVSEVDVKTETVKIVIDGDDIDPDEVNSVVEKYGAVVRSTDGVVARKRGS